jgi:hypothetical protein
LRGDVAHRGNRQQGWVDLGYFFVLHDWRAIQVDKLLDAFVLVTIYSPLQEKQAKANDFTNESEQRLEVRVVELAIVDGVQILLLLKDRDKSAWS